MTSGRNQWSDLIPDTKDDPLLKDINAALDAYNKAYAKGEHTKNHLNEIITACDKYITTIPKSEREAYFFYRKALLESHPALIKVYTLQQQAVSRLYLPEAKTDARARWLLIKPIAMSQDSASSKRRFAKGKMLEKDYWKEVKYKGKGSVVYWLSQKPDKLDSMYSYQEMLEQEKIKRGLNRRDIPYHENPEDNKVEIDQKRLYITNKDGHRQLFDTRGIKEPGRLDDRPDHCLFTVGMDGSIYVSGLEPKKQVLHSSFLQGGPALCAGKMKVIDGEIKIIVLYSGHYKPGVPELLNFLKLLKDVYKLDLTKIEIITYDNPDPQNADVFLKRHGGHVMSSPTSTSPRLFATADEEKEEKLHKPSQSSSKKSIKLPVDDVFSEKTHALLARAGMPRKNSPAAYAFIRRCFLKYSQDESLDVPLIASAARLLAGEGISHEKIITKLLSKTEYATFDEETLLNFLKEFKAGIGDKALYKEGDVYAIITLTKQLTPVDYDAIEIKKNLPGKNEI